MGKRIAIHSRSSEHSEEINRLVKFFVAKHDIQSGYKGDDLELNGVSFNEVMCLRTHIDSYYFKYKAYIVCSLNVVKYIYYFT